MKPILLRGVMMKKIILLSLLVPLFGAALYGADGWIDAERDSIHLSKRADTLLAQEKSGMALGPERLEWFLTVEDPNYFLHNGIDLTTAGAGLSTITQSLSKRFAFKKWQPGIKKIRQSTYAMSLERNLTKDQILALFLDTAGMGRGPDGWMTGFYLASETIYNATPAQISDKQFLSLVAVLIAPGRLTIASPNAELEQRVSRLFRLVEGQCAPINIRDVWFENCA